MVYKVYNVYISILTFLIGYHLTGLPHFTSLRESLLPIDGCLGLDSCSFSSLLHLLCPTSFSRFVPYYRQFKPL